MAVYRVIIGGGGGGGEDFRDFLITFYSLFLSFDRELFSLFFEVR